MVRFIDRREFAVASSALLATCIPVEQSICGEHPGISKSELLLKGINALARSPDMKYFEDGHRGASMISAHLMCVDNELDDATAQRIIQLFDLNWGPTKLCEDFLQEEPDPKACEKVGLALADNSGVLREVGHDAIFAMHAIKAFRMLPESATPGRVEGVCRLIREFKPWRDVPPSPEVDPPPFSDSQAASQFILKETSDAIDRFMGFGQGFAGHMLTFGQSLVELARMGDEEWAESCRVAFRKYVTVTRQGPEADARKIADHKPSNLRPNQTEYWNKRGDKTLGIGHVFKYPYAYYELLAHANSTELSTELDSKAYNIF
ncbi:MAG: hypothetical protein KDB03_18150 [Planctomycetales bacterium]|nr:hypothetical protein [Planctomycetales bacterium]